MKKSRIALLFTVVIGLIASLAAMGLGDEATYAGTSKCKPCHFKQYKSWSETRMANSFDLLKPGERADAKKAAKLDPNKDYTTDAKCLKCHTTGYGKTGGFTSEAETPTLKGVGCEMCHGPGSVFSGVMLKNKEFKLDEVVKAGLASPITEKRCAQCHNADSPFVGGKYKFVFAERVKIGIHEHFALKYSH